MIVLVWDHPILTAAVLVAAGTLAAGLVGCWLPLPKPPVPRLRIVR